MTSTGLERLARLFPKESGVDIGNDGLPPFSNACNLVVEVELDLDSLSFSNESSTRVLPFKNLESTAAGL